MKQRHSSVTLDRIVSMIQADDNEGICLACGEDAYGVEPDARIDPAAPSRLVPAAVPAVETRKLPRGARRPSLRGHATSDQLRREGWRIAV